MLPTTLPDAQMATDNYRHAQASALKDRLSGGKPMNLDLIHEKAREFEAMFVTQMLKPMFDTLKTDGMFGGGQGEETYRGLLVDEYGKEIARAGGIGIADSIARQMILMQEQQA